MTITYLIFILIILKLTGLTSFSLLAVSIGVFVPAEDVSTAAEAESIAADAKVARGSEND